MKDGWMDLWMINGLGKQFSVGFHFPSAKTSHKIGSVFGRTQ
jgi:hypothetical protein